MYIVFESIAGDDPVWSAGLERFNNFWIYTVAKFDDAFNNINLEYLKADIISEEVAKASMLANAQNNKVQIKANTPQYDLILDNESGKVHQPKVFYELTIADAQNAIVFIKTVLKNYARNHLDSLSDQDFFNNEVDACNTIDECNWLMYHYLEISNYNTYGDKTPKKQLIWK